ncbi:MAG TPA: hypothetical protein VF737_14550 [Gemmatimonadaceae bacterium]
MRALRIPIALAVIAASCVLRRPDWPAVPQQVRFYYGDSTLTLAKSAPGPGLPVTLVPNDSVRSVDFAVVLNEAGRVVPGGLVVLSTSDPELLRTVCPWVRGQSFRPAGRGTPAPSGPWLTVAEVLYLPQTERGILRMPASQATLEQRIEHDGVIRPQNPDVPQCR